MMDALGSATIEILSLEASSLLPVIGLRIIVDELRISTEKDKKDPKNIDSIDSFDSIL
jgi:hypothetical protein